MFLFFPWLPILPANTLPPPSDVGFIYSFRELPRRGDVFFFFCSAPPTPPVLSVFRLIHSVLKYFYFAQIIPTFCEGGGEGEKKDVQVYWHFYVWFSRSLSLLRVGGGDAGGEKRQKKPNTLPLSIECINIKFDSLASSLLPLFSSSCDVHWHSCFGWSQAGRSFETQCVWWWMGVFLFFF